MPFRFQLRVHFLGDIAGNREANPLAPARLRKDQRVYSHDASVRIQQWSAAIARIDRGVRLDVNHRIVALDLPRHRAHHAHAHGVIQAQRIAKRQYDLPLLQSV